MHKIRANKSETDFKEQNSSEKSLIIAQTKAERTAQTQKDSADF